MSLTCVLRTECSETDAGAPSVHDETGKRRSVFTDFLVYTQTYLTATENPVFSLVFLTFRFSHSFSLSFADLEGSGLTTIIEMYLLQF